jgi:hypothetical protein
MPPKGNRQGRQPFGHHNDANRSRAPSENRSRAPSVTPSQTGSTASKRGRKKKSKAKGGANKENDPPNPQKRMTNEQVTKLLDQIQRGMSGMSVGETKDVMPNNPANDMPVNKDNIVRKDFAWAQKNNDGHWSNYPVALPPRLTVDIMKAL